MKRLFVVFALSSAVCGALMSTAAHAQEVLPLQGLTWTVAKGDNTVENDSGTIHITQRQPGSTSHYAVMTANTNLGNTQNWKITFDYRVGVRRPAGSSLQLFSRGERILIAGGDSIGVPAVLVGEKKLIELQRDDQSWHHVELNCELDEVTTTFDSKEIGRSPGIHAPDLIEVGTRNPVASQQTELWVRNITVGSPAEVHASKPAHAQEAAMSQGLSWSVYRGANSVETNDKMIHIDQPIDKDTADDARVSADLGINNASQWRVSFDVRFGQLRTQGVRTQLGSDANIVSWIGADGWYKGMGVVVGSDRRIYGQPADSEWHKFEYVCAGRDLAVWHNGTKVAQVPLRGVPDRLTIGSWGEKLSPGKQTEIWVRNIVVSSSGERASSNSDVPSSITDTFANGPLSGLWNLKPNGGSISKSGSELMFLPSRAQDSFGEMTSRPGTLPAGSSWKVHIRFRFPHIGLYGLGLAIEEPSDPDTIVFRIHAPAALGLPQVLLAGGPMLKLNNPKAWHELAVENKSGKWAVWMDSNQIATGDIPSREFRLRFGGNIEHISAGDFTTFALQSVRIDYTDGPRPLWLPDLLKTRTPFSGDLPVSKSSPNSASVLKDSPKRISSLGLALGVDSRVQAPAYPASDGHLVVTASNTVLQVPRGSVIEFRPQLSRPDYAPIVVHLLVNHKIIETKDVFLGRTNQALPSFVVDAPATSERSTLVSIVAADINRRQIEVSYAKLVLAPTDAPTSFVLQDEKVRLTASKEKTPKAIYAFLEDQYLGCLKVSLESFAVDARHLPVGQHKFWLITESSDGAIHPPTDSTITILPRFKLNSIAQDGTFVVDRDKLSFPVHVHREAGTGISKSFVYCAGAFIGESDKADFDMPVRATDINSGTVTIEAVGVGMDGSLYPPESIQVRVRNVYTDSLAATNHMYKELHAVISEINAIDQEVGYWYTRACNEPDFITYSSGKQISFYEGFERVMTVSYITSITVPGKVADYLGMCKAAIIKRAKVRLDIGRRYKHLGQNDAAKSSLQQAVREAGADSGTGLAALKELQGL